MVVEWKRKNLCKNVIALLITQTLNWTNFYKYSSYKQQKCYWVDLMTQGLQMLVSISEFVSPNEVN